MNWKENEERKGKYNRKEERKRKQERERKQISKPIVQRVAKPVIFDGQTYSNTIVICQEKITITILILLFVISPI
ncbi:MAG: hypothetical protein K2X69_11305 [Silvanigrellaceae bacterium]|nr:hypothetical protein [Silvanigrellaceae bacterium]